MTDNSLLHFRELWIGQGRRQKRTYTYHYQRSDGALVFRYDNAPHYPEHDNRRANLDSR